MSSKTGQVQRSPFITLTDSKASLFTRVADVVPAGGRLVLGDVVVPQDPADLVTPIDDDGYELRR